MTEHLTALLHGEAAALDVPTPATAVILEQGRRRRRTRSAVTTTVVAGLALAIGIAVTLLPRDTSQRLIDPARIAPFEAWGAVAVGQDVYVGDAHVHWDAKITAMYYTSEGVVVRSSGRYSLVRADGETTPISVDIPDRVPGFEPDSTRFAYARPSGSAWVAVVHDAATDEELAQVAVPGQFTWSGWAAPPVSIDGDVVWLHLDDGWTEVNWRTGDYRRVPGTRQTFELANGRYAVQSGRSWQVRSMSDSALVGTVDLPRGWYAFFSPDGRFLRSFPNEGSPEEWSPRVYDVAAGTTLVVDDPGEDFGWTPSGDRLVVDDDELRVCAPTTDECRSRPFDRGSGELRIGGNPYES
jgi:hypothetical protein